MQDPASREDIFALREVLAVQIAVAGVEEDRTGGGHSTWETQLGTLNGVVLTAALGEDYTSAENLDKQNQKFNDNADLGQDFALSLVKIPPGASVLVDTGLE